MGDLIDRIPSDVFWTAVIAWGLGVFCASRAMYLLARIRDRWGHAVHHWERAAEFVRGVRQDMTAAAVAGLMLLGFFGGIGLLVYLRVAGS